LSSSGNAGNTLARETASASSAAIACDTTRMWRRIDAAGDGMVGKGTPSTLLNNFL
jgi:hypothetical protein